MNHIKLITPKQLVLNQAMKDYINKAWITTKRYNKVQLLKLKLDTMRRNYKLVYIEIKHDRQDEEYSIKTTIKQSPTDYSYIYELSISEITTANFRVVEVYDYKLIGIYKP